ncbi:PREDICTED: protein spire homolog 2 [Condylura cristata]|uniref:protein spire homolog 2 n=1 Tax=Condylura cristata TaxID=143302 RepID=UPI000643E23B|nr:PREDICTED: protein spire homolog 2 [Condylura cristata]
MERHLQSVQSEPATMVVSPASSEAQMVQSLGFAIYRALDWGLDESEERELSPQLERLIDLMANNDGDEAGCGADEGYGGPEEEEEAEGGPRAVRTFAQAMRLCAGRLTDPRGAPAHYQAVCRALFVETLELQAFLARVREAKEVSPGGGLPLPLAFGPAPTAWRGLGAGTWVGVPLLAPRQAGATPSRRPCPQASREGCAVRSTVRAAGGGRAGGQAGLLCPQEEESPCGELALKRDRSFSEHDLAQLRSEMAAGRQPASEPPGGPAPAGARGSVAWGPGAQEQGLPAGSSQGPPDPRSVPCGHCSAGEAGMEASPAPDASHRWMEFSHPAESLALTVEEVMDVRRVLVKAEMEKFLQHKELLSGLKKGKICCCCRTRFPLFSWPSSCLFCKRAVCSSCSVKMKMPSRKLAHIPVYVLGFESPLRAAPAAQARLTQKRGAFQSPQAPRVEEEFPHMYAHGSVLKDACADCAHFVADVVRSSRRSVRALNASPRRARQTQSLYVPHTWTLDFQ